MPAVGPSLQATPEGIRTRHRSDPPQERVAGSAIGSLLVSNTAPLRMRHPSAPSGARRVSTENYPPVAGSPDAMRQTTTLRALHCTMDGVRRALQSGDTEAGRRAAAALLGSGVQRRLVLDLQLSSATPALRQAGVDGNLHWLHAVTGLVREQALPAAEVIGYLLVPGSDGRNAPSTSRYLRDPALGQAFVTLLDTLHENDSSNGALTAMRGRARSHLVAAGPAVAAPPALHDVVQQACEATQPTRLAGLESSLLRRSVEANMPALITASEAEAVDRMVVKEFQSGGADGLGSNPVFQSTPSRVRTLEEQMQDARATYTREVGGLRRRQGEELVANIQQEYEEAVLAEDPALSNVQRGALLRQLSGHAVQGVDRIVHIFHPGAEAEEEDPAPVRTWTGAGSRPAALVTIEGADWRVKETGDTGLSAMEASLSRVFQLTGLAAPDARVVDADPSLPGDSQRFASRYEPSFMDLGRYLDTPAAEALAAAGDEAARMGYARLRGDHAAAVSDCDAILQRAGVDHFWQLKDAGLQAAHAAADRRRFDALEAMNRLLPTAQRSDQVRHFIASRWLGNWDHLNFRMENFGYAERDGQPLAMTVDFGSCGPLGFATLDARRVMLPKQASADIALLQRPASLFPIPDAFVENAAEFDAMGADPGRLHDTLGWPYGFQSESVADLMRTPAVPDPAIADAMAEMGYRLALIPAATVHAVIGAGWQVPADAPEGRWPDAATMAGVLVQRRQALLAQYAPGQIRDWISTEPERAAQVRQQMLDGIGAALDGAGDSTVQREHAAALQARHQMLLDGDFAAIVGDPNAREPNAVTARIRALQRLHDCNRRMAAALDTHAEADIRAIAGELLSPSVFGELLTDLELGAGADERRRTSFEANRDWLLLVKRLVDDGYLAAAQVTHCLLQTFEGATYPPNIGAHAHRDPALGMAFIELMETLMARSVDITPALLREGLLTAKVKGFPNYYAALAASGASIAWDQRLQQAELLPGNAEYIRLRSLRSWAVKKVSYELRRGDEPLHVDGHAQRLAALPLRDLIQHVDAAYGTRRVIELELPEIRASLRMKLTSQVEEEALTELVQRSVEGAWKEAIVKHRLPRDTPVPPRMLEELERSALGTYRDQMKKSRMPEAEALIRAGEQHYTDAVLAQPDMALAERRQLLKQRAEEITSAISSMVRAAGDSDEPAVDARAIGQRAQQQGASTAAELAAHATAQAQQDAQAQARARAEQQARSKAGESAQRASTSAAAKASHAAALAASSQARAQAQAAARSESKRRADERAAKDASARATRDAIVHSTQFNNEVQTRLAMLRAPTPPGAAPSSSRQTQRQIEQRAAALRNDRRNAQLYARLEALRADVPGAASAPRSSAGRQRTRQYVDPSSGASGSTTR
ncbi:hypothetical protein EDF77_2555 [Stenotrophomonas maltophilia]|uniref:hypothetical protein n=1 Tax=Stenotrophomonas chelatiphaga TaxID=517011 RepID=UPI000F9FD8FD|nr:hypothetical protein [Stenotrophomonas chelatiphaga]MCS4230729.1 hypothetical protein [Stenotrophomonas chelatiphaga]ROQ40224.1 hypothetical protein EDF77_2555 [Stenotrophomonas maltophilia]